MQEELPSPWDTVEEHDFVVPQKSFCWAKQVVQVRMWASFSVIVRSVLMVVVVVVVKVTDVLVWVTVVKVVVLVTVVIVVDVSGQPLCLVAQQYALFSAFQPVRQLA